MIDAYEARSRSMVNRSVSIDSLVEIAFENIELAISRGLTKTNITAKDRTSVLWNRDIRNEVSSIFSNKNFKCTDMSGDLGIASIAPAGISISWDHATERPFCNTKGPYR